MTILKVMFAVAIGTYVAYELTIRNKKSGDRKEVLPPGQERMPL